MPQLQERRPEQQRQYLPRFDLLDVGQDERPELHGELAKASVQIVHLAAIRTATRGWVATTAPRRVAFRETFPRKRRTELSTPTPSPFSYQTHGRF